MAEEKKKDDSKTELKIDPREQPVFAWDAPEFAAYDKSGGWTVWIILGAIVVGGVFIWLKNWTGLALVVAAGIALISQGHSKPKNIRCAIFQGGVVVKEKPYNFSDLKSFWIFLSPNSLVRFEKASRFATPLTLPLGKTDPEQIRLFLLKRLPEHEDRGEDFSDRISRWLKF